MLVHPIRISPKGITPYGGRNRIRREADSNDYANFLHGLADKLATCNCNCQECWSTGQVDGKLIHRNEMRITVFDWNWPKFFGWMRLHKNLNVVHNDEGLMKWPEASKCDELWEFQNINYYLEF
jgi:hypothetical protein